MRTYRLAFLHGLLCTPWPPRQHFNWWRENANLALKGGRRRLLVPTATGLMGSTLVTCHMFVNIPNVFYCFLNGIVLGNLQTPSRRSVEMGCITSKIHIATVPGIDFNQADVSSTSEML